MTKGTHIKRALALSTAFSVVVLGATTTAAEASLDPGKSQGKSQSQHKSQGKSHEEKAKPAKSSSDKGSSTGSQGKATGHDKGDTQPSSTGHSNGNGSSQGGGSTSDHGPADKGDQDQGPKVEGGKGGDPAGNNGTVKITPHGEVDGIPQNTPHVGCTFDVEWYGFDEGAESNVYFEAWSPTQVAMDVAGPENPIDIGDDPASGAGVGSDEDGTDADNGFDGEATYTLSFPEGGAHPKQGYHVKLTIHSTDSQGADVKHKVFWVQECDEVVAPTEETPDEETPDEETPEVEVEGEQGNDVETEVEVLGEQAAVDAEVSGAPAEEALPNAVDAGIEQADTVSPVSTLPLMMTLYGALLAGLALLIRRRRTS